MEKNNWRREGAETWFQVRLLFVCLRFLFFLKCWEILAPSLLMCCCSSRRWRNQFNRFFFTFFFLTKTGKYKKAAAPFKQTQLLKLQLLKRLFAIFKRNKKKSRFVCQRVSFIVTQWRQQKKKVPFCVFFFFSVLLSWTMLEFQNQWHFISKARYLFFENNKNNTVSTLTRFSTQYSCQKFLV